MNPNPKFFFNYASRSRPSNFFRGLDNIVENIQTDNYFIIATLDIDDKTMANEEVKNRIATYKNVKAYWGFSKSKVDAINKNLQFAGDFDVILNMSDDFIFTTKAFDSFIVEAIQKYAPDGDIFCHFHDGNQNRLSTMAIEDKKYFDRFGYIYHPSYISLWADNEEQQKAKILGKYKYMGDKLKILRHIHPMHGHGLHLMDDQYRHTESFNEVDKANYFKRLAKNFDL